MVLLLLDEKPMEEVELLLRLSRLQVLGAGDKDGDGEMAGAGCGTAS